MTLVKLNQPKPLNGFMDDFFNDLPSVFGSPLVKNQTPAVNIIETNDAYRMELNVPGRSKEDFKINVDNKILTVSFEKKDEQKNENEKHIRREFSFHAFKRTFTLDDKIAADKIGAKYDNGLLVITLPKKDEVKPAVKEIEIQ